MPTTRRDLRKALFALASEQSGYFSAAQAKRVGYSYQAQAHHVTSGNWIRFDRGIFRLAEWLPQPHDELARWSLWSHGRAVVSHETALAVHSIGEFESGQVHLTVPPGFRQRDMAVVLHTAELADADIEDRPGFRLTTPQRSIIDVAATGADEEQLTRGIAQAEEEGLLTIRALCAQAEVVDVRAALYIERAVNRMAER